MTQSDTPLDHPEWPLRTALLAALGAVLGWGFFRLVDTAQPDDRARFAAAAFLAVGGIAFAFSLERLRRGWAAVFALAAGLVVAGVTYWSGTPDRGSAEGPWQIVSALLAVAIAVPLFQALRDEGRRAFPVRPVHFHAWSNLILWGAAWAFVAASLLLLLLLSELFRLIGLDFLRDLLRHGGFVAALVGGALGGAVGVLRDRDPMLVGLQRVARAVLSFLAPVLALGLGAFVLALPFTGLAPLWEQTKATTPILLVCAAGAVLLVNAVIGNGPDEESAAPPLRWAGAALAALLLPLAAVAALSIGKRVGQYGFTPDRLWTLVFVAVAAASAAAYLAALLKGRGRWPDLVRRANVRLALGICLLALFLALPILGFGAISARDQVARLESGRVAPDRFDWAALRFDFGPAGRRALERLAASGAPAVRERAREALKAGSRYDLERDSAPPPRVRLSVDGNRPVPEALRRAVARDGECSEGCRLSFTGSGEAILVARPCDTCVPGVRLYVSAPDGEWAQSAATAPAWTEAAGKPLGAARIELREVRKRQVFVDGRPVGPVFDPAP